MKRPRKSDVQRCLLAAAVIQACWAAPVLAQEVAAPHGADASGDAAQAHEKKTVVLKEVTVTAQRRSQKLQDVPLSVTAIDEAELNARGIANVADLSAVAPNLQVSATPGDSTAAQIAIRGMAGYNPALT